MAFLSVRGIEWSVVPRIPAAGMAVLLALAVALAALPPVGGVPVPGDVLENATAWNSQRKIGRDSLGRLYVALLVADPDLGDAVRVFESANNGATWAALPRVPDATAAMSRASLAVDLTDRVHLVWTELVGTDLQVFHAVWRGAWSPRTQVSFTPGYSGFPSGAVDPGDRLHVAWYGFDGSTYQVYYRVRAPNGTWGPTETVSTGLRDANNPALAIGPQGEPHVAWFLFTGSRWFVVYTVRNETRWAPVVTLSGDGNRALDPSLAVTAQGDVVAAWAEVDPNGTWAVVARVRTAAGWEPSVPLAAFTASGGHPAVALDGQDRAFVFWDERDAAIRYRTFNGTWGSTETIPTSGTATFPSARWARVANPLYEGVNRVDVAWTEAVGDGFRVSVAGIPVPATGAPPPTSQGFPTALVLLAIAAVSALAIVVLRWRRRRRDDDGGPP